MAKPVVEIVRVGKRGEITLPRRIRNTLQLHEGEELMLSVIDQRLLLERRPRNFATYLDVIGNGIKDEE
jgi:AbrB family looped-hinge helix DNA binding protein